MQQGYRAEKAIGYQKISVLSAATALTVPSGCGLIIFQAESQGVRFRDDGTNPTAATGYPLAAGSEFVYTGDAQSMAALRFIEQAASAALSVLYYALP